MQLFINSFKETAMKKILDTQPALMTFMLAIGFSAGILLLSLMGSLPGKAAHDQKSPPEEVRITAKGHELLDEFSVAFESASAKVNQSVVPIFSEQVTEVDNPFASPNNPFHQFFGDDFFNHFFSGGEKQKEVVHALGSGVIVSPDGYILTNNHVVDGAQKLTVRVGKDKKYTAKLIGRDPNTDVAVVKIDAKDLPVASLGNSNDVHVGQWVIAVGNPFELMHTVTAGIISAKGRSSVNLADYEDFIQTDASINPGNSGGALADLDGNVVGINTAIYSPSGGNVGIGFAIPINMAKHVMDELIRHGKVTRGFLGLVPQDVDESLQKAMNLPSTNGALVGDVNKDGPADKAGLKRGDVIMTVDGKEITSSLELRNRIADSEPGSTVTLGIIRDGKQKDVSVKLGERPANLASNSSPSTEPDRVTSKELGLSVEALTSEVAGQLGYKDEHGVVISDVIAGSAAGEAGLQRGDLIKEVNRTEVKTPAGFDKAVNGVKSGEPMAFLVRRGQTTFYVGIEAS